jgi:RimJ/RimL family protein N-acetyltransferase
MPKTNKLGQPIGEPLPDWQGVPRPPRTPMEGRFVRIEPLDVDTHLQDLYEAAAIDTEGRIWTYLFVGPYQSASDMRAWLEPAARSEDPLYYALVDRATGKATGVASYLRIQPEHGVIEIGNILYSPLLQRTPAATEAMYLFMYRVFDELGYRRYEWKCDSLNAGSRKAAERLGFQYDGLFRQAIVYKGRNRDTAWYSILDKNWPRLKQAFEKWLSADNFDKMGRQRRRLEEFVEDAEPAPKI